MEKKSLPFEVQPLLSKDMLSNNIVGGLISLVEYIMVKKIG
jgi:hypothetical protein